MKSGEKRLLFLIISVFAIIFSANFILAQLPDANQPVSFSQGVQDFINGSTQVLKPIFELLLGSSNAPGGGSQLAVQILTFALVALVVYGILDTVNLFGTKPWVNIWIGIIVSILGVRFLPPGYLEAAAIPSSALALAITMGVPFIITFILISRVPGPLVRRALWTGYGVIILVLWMYNLSNPNIPNSAKWLYPLIIIGCIIAFAFDGTLQRFIGKAKRERSIEKSTNKERDIVEGELKRLQTALANATTPNQRTRIREEIKNQRENLKSL